MFRSFFEKGITVAEAAFRPAAELKYEARLYRGVSSALYCTGSASELSDDTLRTNEQHVEMGALDSADIVTTIAAICVSSCHETE